MKLSPVFWPTGKEPRSADAQRPFKTSAPAKTAERVSASVGAPSNGQSLAYVYGHADVRDAQVANALTLDEARRIASNIAKLPSLLGKAE
jgi:hypothetical protein